LRMAASCRWFRKAAARKTYALEHPSGFRTEGAGIPTELRGKANEKKKKENYTNTKGGGGFSHLNKKREEKKTGARGSHRRRSHGNIEEINTEKVFARKRTQTKAA